MATDAHRIIRARQRSRSALRSFATPLAPSLTEVGIDRMVIKVKGTWSCSTPDDYLDLVATGHPDIDWFCAPSRSPSKVAFKSRTPARSTISEMHVTVSRRWGGPGGTIAADVKCNPTRTLAHLLTAYTDRELFAEIIDRLSPIDFFARSEVVPLSLDGGDNWIADVDAARAALGNDIFGAFLPIFARNIRSLVMQMVAPTYGAVEPSLGAIVANGVEVRMDWSHASSPQIESYFERFHSQARTIIRSAAQTVLAGLDNASVRHHLDQTSFERSGDLFTIATPLPGKRQLVLYAKARDRIRFEVRKYKGGGRYTSTPDDAGDRLLIIMNSERRALLERPWATVGDFLLERDKPVIADLHRLILLTLGACASRQVDPRPVVEALLTDGGLVRTGTNKRLLDELCQIGVLERISLWQRGQRGPRRYMLTADFRAAYDAMLAGFSREMDDC